jgi:hypothetical protein
MTMNYLLIIQGTGQTFKNVTVIQGWKREWTTMKLKPKPKCGKGEEHDFIIIDGSRRLIILVEAKKTLKSCTVKNAKIQLTQQVEYIRDYHGHVLTPEWKIATVIVYEEMRLENVCHTCLDFLIGPNELKSLKSWWENLGTKLNSLRQVETALSTLTSENGKNCYKKLVARIIGFSSSCFKSTIKSVRDEVSTALKGNTDLVSAGPSKELVLSGRKEKKIHLNPGTRDKVPIELKESANLVSACPSKELVLSGKKEKKTHLNLGTEEKVQRAQKESEEMVSGCPSKELAAFWYKGEENSLESCYPRKSSKGTERKCRDGVGWLLKRAGAVWYKGEENSPGS